MELSGETENFYGSRCLEWSPEHGHLNEVVLVVEMDTINM